MTKIDKIYSFYLPFTKEEYTKGQAYIVEKMSNEDADDDFKIEILESRYIPHEKHGKVHKTHKVMYLEKKIPGILKKLIHKDAYIVDEISITDPIKCKTTYENRYFPKSTFNMEFNTIIKEGADLCNNPFEYDDAFNAEIEKIDIQIHKNVKDKKYNPSEYFHEETKRGKLTDGWVQKYDSEGHPIIVVYKHITVEVNKMMLGWVAGKIEKRMRDLVLLAQQRIFCSMDQWYGMSLEELQKKIDPLPKN